MKKNWKIIWYTLAFIAIIFFTFHALWWRVLTTDEGINPIFVVFLRLVWGVFILILFLPFVTKKGDFKKLFNKNNNILKNKNFWISSVFLAVNLVLFVAWTEYSSASNVMLIEALSPIVVWLISFAYFKNKNYSNRMLFFIIIFATIGTSLLFSDNSLLNSNSWSSKVFWDILAFIWMIFFAIFSFFYVELRKDFKDTNGLIITIMFLSVWMIITSPALIYYNDLMNISETGLIFLALVSFWWTWISYLTWFLAWEYLSAIVLAMLFNLVWLTAIISEYIYYWENSNPITYKLYLWTIIILWAVPYMNYIDSKK